MGPKDHERIAYEWLDTALKQYGETEPPTGLEGRLLATLRAESERVPPRRNWWPALAAVAAMVIVAGVAATERAAPPAMIRGTKSAADSREWRISRV